MNVFKENRNFFYKIAQKNTVKNKLGETTISRQDESFDDDIWEQAYKESLDERNKSERHMVCEVSL